MSTLKANSYQHVDRASPSIIINSDGSVSISSTVTYEDVTSVDAVGVITGRSNADLQNRVNVGSGVSIKAGGLEVTAGVSTFNNGLNVTGNITNGLNVSAGIATFAGSIDANSNVHIAGITTIAYTGTSQYGLDVVNATSGSSGLRVRAGDADAQYSFLVEDGAGTNLFEVMGGGGGANLRSGSLYILDKIIHYGDTNTSIRFPSADTITAETGGTERLRIKSNGYMGVGNFSSKVASITDPLNVDSGIGTCNIGGNYLHLKRYDGSHTNYITAPQDTANLHISADDYIAFGVDHSSSQYSHGTEALRIASNGRLGVGTATPRAFLDLCGAAENATLLLDSNDENSNICLMDNTGSVRLLNYGGALALRTGGTGAFTGDNERVRINSTGQVAIAAANASLPTHWDSSTRLSVNGRINAVGSASTASMNTGNGTVVNIGALTNHNLQFIVNNSTKATINTDGNTNFAGIVTATSFVPTVGQTGFKNLIINGDMQISQRNGTSSSTIPKSSTQYHLDRFQTQTASLDELSASIAQVTDAPDGFAHAMKVTVSTPESVVNSNEYASIYQKLEGQDLQQLKYGTSGATDVTMSFWVKSSITGTFSYTVYRSESAQNRIVNKTYTINSANTWERKTITIAGDTSNGITDDSAARWWNVWHLGAGADWSSVTSSTWANYSNTNWAGGVGTNAVLTTNGATWAITGVQLEVGSQATPFEYISYGQNFKNCQRYYQTVGYGNHLAITNAINNNGNRIPVPMFQTTMRAAPTYTSEASLTSFSAGSSFSVTGTYQYSENGGGYIQLGSTPTNGIYLKIKADAEI